MKSDPTRNERQRRWYWSHKEYKNKRSHDRYWDFRNAGRCPCCGNDPEPERILCRVCQNKRNGIEKMMKEGRDERW